MTTSSLSRRANDPIDRKAAQAAEDNFLDRFAANVNALPAVYNPLDNRMYDTGPRNRARRLFDRGSQEVKALIKKRAERDLMKTYEEMPKNGAMVFDIWHKEMFAPRAVRVGLAAAAWHPLEDLVVEGKSARPAGPKDLEERKDLLITQPEVFYYVGLFSSTGWAESCRKHVVGGNYVIALCDLTPDGWRSRHAPDPRWRGAGHLFDLATDEEKIHAVRRFVSKNTFRLIMDELTEELILEELGYPLPVIREAMELIASEDPYVRLDASLKPFRLVRTYR